MGQGAAAQQLTIRIEGIRSEEGLLHVGFYESEKQWKSEKSNFQRHSDKRTFANGVVTFVVDDVQPGRYAAALADDENSNGHIDWGILLPIEGFGFSNYVHRGLRRPNFDDFDFELKAGENLTITFVVKYL